MSVENYLNVSVSVVNLTPRGKKVTFEADKEACELLVRNHAIHKLNHFSFDVHLTPYNKVGVKMHGTLKAEFEQLCVVSLEPIEQSIEEEMTVFFLPEGALEQNNKDFRNKEIIVDLEETDEPEIFSGNTINIGKIAEEFFELAIPVYPRSDKAVIEEKWSCSEDDKLPSIGEQAFKALSKLKLNND